MVPAKIVKASEDGIVEGIPFTISGNGVEETVVTGENGTVEQELLAGHLPCDRAAD